MSKNHTLKIVGRRTLKYVFFLVAVMAWMIVLGPKETLTAEEQLYLTEFTAQLDAPSAAPVQVASETPVVSDTQYGVILEDSVNLRTGPGVDFPAVGQLFKGNQVTIVNQLVGGWTKIAFEGTQYYISSEFITLRTMTGANQ